MTDPRVEASPRFALWDLGFRPFYLAAGPFATISIPLWVVQYAGALPIAIAVAIGIPLVRSRNRRNYFFVRLMVLIGAAALAYHLSFIGGMLFPDAHLVTVGSAGLCWSAAFATFTVRYWPVLTRARLDGKPG